ncbi:hypothetical protein ASG54_04505 [Aureimonas sp. Leaf460]|nr:hypothetical protein ASG54_04505 [Aureimonas sp. Leaf460]KQT69332.1 hypothetical protein ASG62_17110 [Aureimonas sp. Leaf427]
MRCPLCEARAIGPSGRHLVYPSGRARRFPLACAFCGLALAEEAEPGSVRTHLLGSLDDDGFTLDEDALYGLDIYTLRTAATLKRRGVEPEGEAQARALRQPHAPLAASARLFDLAQGPAPVSLGILCRPEEIDRVLATLAPHAAWTDDIVVLADADLAAPQVVESFGAPPVRLAARPLAGDFAGQRNALRDLARHGWMLQLDADETLAPETGRLFGALVELAEASGVRSIGLPRRNLVDGVLSDLFPDTQYRLNHRSVRYAGRVHERPERPWQESLVAGHGAILHHLGRAHVEARSQRYEAMAPGGGRLEEAELLLRPYRC